MHPLKKTQGIDWTSRDINLKGRVDIKLHDAVTGRLKEHVVAENMQTNGLKSLLCQCPFGLDRRHISDCSSPSWYNTPLYRNALGGVLLFNDALGNDPNLLFPPFTNKVHGMASMESYSQTDSRQGTFDEIASAPVTNGYRYVYNWGSSYGNTGLNEHISSLGLSTVRAHWWCQNSGTMLAATASSYWGYTARYSTAIGTYGYVTAVSDSGVLVYYIIDGKDYFRFFKYHKPLGASIFENPQGTGQTFVNLPFGKGDGYSMQGYTWKLDRPISGDISTNINNWYYFTTEIIGDYVYIISHNAWSGNASLWNDVTVRKYNIADGSQVSIDTFTVQNGSLGHHQIAYYNGNFYCMNAASDAILKFNSSGVILAEIPTGRTLTDSRYGGLFYTSSNWIYGEYGILDADTDTFVNITDGQWYSGWTQGHLFSADEGFVPIYDNGMWLITRVQDRNGYLFNALAKMWGLMTHFDLQTPVEKDASKTMTVTYTITQV